MPATKTQDNKTVVFHEVPLSKQDILNCSYSNWYSKFSKHTISRAEILKPIPKEFLEYLESDDFTLPKDALHETSLFQAVEPNSDNEYSDWENDDGDGDGNGKSNVKAETKSNKPDPSLQFQDFHNQIKRVFKSLRRVSPKLNWSAPQDAAWISVTKSMQCSSPSELYLLLKSSDYVNHDLYHAFDGIEEDDSLSSTEVEPELVLRKWVDINPSTEFRCFVRDRQLIAITQRDLNFYQFLPDMQDQLVETIGMFFDDVLLPKFDSNNFVFDVYVPKPFNRVYLIDVNPFARKTDPLLFTWNELITMTPKDDEPEFRLVTEHNSGRFACKAHAQNHVPKDVVDASMDTSAMVELAQQWAKMLSKEDPDPDTDSITDDDEK